MPFAGSVAYGVGAAIAGTILQPGMAPAVGDYAVI